MKIHGGILPLLAELASQALPFITGTVLPALEVGALSSLASNGGVQKLMGNVLYIKKVDVYARSKRMENDCFSSAQMGKFLLNTAMVYI